MDYSLLDDNVINAINRDVVNTGDGDNDDDDVANSEENSNDTEEEKMDVDNGIGTNNTKVKKVNIHDSAAVNILQKGVH